MHPSGSPPSSEKGSALSPACRARWESARNKLQAKIASVLAKPRGAYRLGSENWKSVMDRRSLDTLRGVGSKRGRVPSELTIVDVGGLAHASEQTLRQAFAPNIGTWLRQIARGIDETRVMAERPPARSLGHQTTYQRDLIDPVAVALEVARLASIIAAELEAAGKLAQRVVVVISFAPFETHRHRAALARRTPEESQIAQAALIAPSVSSSISRSGWWASGSSSPLIDE